MSSRDAWDEGTSSSSSVYSSTKSTESATSATSTTQLTTTSSSSSALSPHRISNQQPTSSRPQTSSHAESYHGSRTFMTDNRRSDDHDHHAYSHRYEDRNIYSHSQDRRDLRHTPSTHSQNRDGSGYQHERYQQQQQKEHSYDHRQQQQRSHHQSDHFDRYRQYNNDKYNDQSWKDRDFRERRNTSTQHDTDMRSNYTTPRIQSSSHKDPRPYSAHHLNRVSSSVSTTSSFSHKQLSHSSQSQSMSTTTTSTSFKGNPSSSTHSDQSRTVRPLIPLPPPPVNAWGEKNPFASKTTTEATKAEQTAGKTQPTSKRSNSNKSEVSVEAEWVTVGSKPKSNTISTALTQLSTKSQPSQSQSTKKDTHHGGK